MHSRYESQYVGLFGGTKSIYRVLLSIYRVLLFSKSTYRVLLLWKSIYRVLLRNKYPHRISSGLGGGGG
jgi:hypothetical protein